MLRRSVACGAPNVHMLRGILGLGLSCVLLCACSDNGVSPHGAGGDTSGAGRGGAPGGAQATAGTSSGAGGMTGGSAGSLGGSAQAGGSTTGGAAPSAGSAAVAGSAAGSFPAGGSGTAGSAAGGAASGSSGAGGADAGQGGAGGTAGAGVSGTAGGGAPAGGTSGTGGGAGGPIADSLSEKYASLFPVGAAVDSQSYTTHAAVLRQHFNGITPENEMKFESLQGTEGRFSYDAADRIVAFAEQNGMKIRGHALVWHTQNPSWLFVNGSGGTVSPATLLTRMRTHISNVVQHFKGKVYAWDVVNEAILEDGSYRTQNEEEGKQSRWYEILGESYIAEAFRAAHEADPDAKLFYNDFYNYIPAKRDGIYEMLRGLLEDGVPVHGVGLQGHLNLEPSSDAANQAYYQHVDQMEAAIELYASLGLEVQVTELDVSLYIPGVTYTSETFYTAATFTDELEAKQAERYRAFFEMFRRQADKLTGVTFWGIADDNTWLSEFSSGRKDFPLLFDTSHEPKKAYDAVVGF
jgi:endo-1,4-beta-xylanase